MSHSKGTPTRNNSDSNERKKRKKGERNGSSMKNDETLVNNIQQEQNFQDQQQEQNQFLNPMSLPAIEEMSERGSVASGRPRKKPKQSVFGKQTIEYVESDNLSEKVHSIQDKFKSGKMPKEGTQTADDFVAGLKSKKFLDGSDAQDSGSVNSSCFNSSQFKSSHKNEQQDGIQVIKTQLIRRREDKQSPQRRKTSDQVGMSTLKINQFEKQDETFSSSLRFMDVSNALEVPGKLPFDDQNQEDNTHSGEGHSSRRRRSKEGRQRIRHTMMNKSTVIRKHSSAMPFREKTESLKVPKQMSSGSISFRKRNTMLPVIQRGNLSNRSYRSKLSFSAARVEEDLVSDTSNELTVEQILMKLDNKAMQSNKNGDLRSHIMNSDLPIDGTEEEVEAAVREMTLSDGVGDKYLKPMDIRDYLKRYDERRINFERRMYNEEEIKASPQVKDILKPRFQFNGSQKQIYKHFVNTYAENHIQNSELLEMTEEMMNRDARQGRKRKGKKKLIEQNYEETCCEKFFSELKGQATVTDQIMIKGKPWCDMRSTCMKPMYLKSPQFNAYPEIERENIKILIQAQKLSRQTELSFQAKEYIKDENTFFVNDKYHKFNKNSLHLLSSRNPLRILLVKIATHWVFDKIILLCIIVNSICLGLKDYIDKENKTTKNQVIEQIEKYFTVAFLFEAAIKILAQGFINGKNAYLQEGWNWLDFIVVCASLLEMFPSMKQMSGLRTFRLFKPLKTLTNYKSMATLVETLISSMKSLGGILGLATFFFLIFAILGISQWMGLTHYRCRLTEFPVHYNETNVTDWLTVPGDSAPCGVRMCEDFNGDTTYCGSMVEWQGLYGNLTVPDIYRDGKNSEANYGVTNFDNIGNALITIFQCITMEGWTSVMYIYQDVYTEGMVIGYFIICIVICSFLLLNLTIAVMLTKYEELYAELDKKDKDSGSTSELKQTAIDAQLPRKLYEFIRNSSDLAVSQEAKDFLAIRQGKVGLKQQLMSYGVVPNETESDKKYYGNPVTRFFYKVATANLFDTFITICIILNTFVLALDRYPEMPKNEMDVMQNFNLFFTAVFTIEVVFKMTGLGSSKYFKDKFNILDIVTVILSLVELCLPSDGEEGGGSAIGAMRALRLFRVFKLFKKGDLRTLMDSIAFTVSSIGTYSILLCLYTYVCALLGMSLFAGSFNFERESCAGEPDCVIEIPRSNFDSFTWAAVTIFQIMIGDNWTTVMYDGYRAHDNLLFSVVSIIFFVGGNIIMLNLFLAILLGNFERSRDFQKKQTLIHSFKEFRDFGFDLSTIMDKILMEGAEHIKIKELHWPKMIVKHEKKYPSTFLRDMLEFEVEYQGDSIRVFFMDPNLEANQVKINEVQISDIVEEVEASSTVVYDSSSQSQSDSSFSAKSDASSLSRGLIPAPDNAQMPRVQNLDKETDMSQSLKSKFTLKPNINVSIESKQPSKQLSGEIPVRFSPMTFKEESGPIQEADSHLELSVAGISYNSSNEDKFKPFNFKEPDQTAPSTKLKRIGFTKMKARTEELQMLNVLTTPKLCDETPGEEDPFQLNELPKTDRPDGGDVISSTALPTDPLKPNSFSMINSFFKVSFKLNQKKIDQTTSKSQQEKHLTRCKAPASRTKKINDKEMAKLIKVASTYIENPSEPKYFQNRFHETVKVQSEETSPIDFKNSRRLSKRKGLIPLPASSSITPSGLDTEDVGFSNMSAFNNQPLGKRKRKLCKFNDLIDHARNSSLFIFHKNWRLRKFCILLLTPVKQDDDEQLNSELVMSEFNKASTADKKMNMSTNKDSVMFGTSPSAKSFLSTNVKKMKCKLNHNQIFDNLILTLIFTSSIMLVVDTPILDPKSLKVQIIGYIDKFHSIIFFIECMIKIIGLGFFSNTLRADENERARKANEKLKPVGDEDPLSPYTSDNWNLLDFFVVMISLFDMYMTNFTSGGSEGLNSLKALRALRALRPLRAIRKYESMRIVVKALLSSFPFMKNVLAVGCLILLIYAIMGVNLFKGQFYRCHGLDEDFIRDYIFTKQDCLDNEGKWLNSQQNFDNVANAYMILFEMMTTEGWMSVMYNGIDAAGIDMQPQKNNNTAYIAYFIAYMIIGSQFIINLFVGVVIDNFTKIKEKEELGGKGVYITDSQQRWLDVRKIMLHKSLLRDVPNPQGYQKSFRVITTSQYFDWFITFCIILNTVAMAVVHLSMTNDFKFMLEMCNYVFAAIFNMEMILKLFAMGKTYFQEGWNWFDCFIVIGTDIGILMNVFNVGASLSSATSVIRGFRIFRIFRLIKSSPEVTLIIQTVVNIMPSITNIMSLMVILIFIFAALGLNLFSTVMLQDQLNEKNNFRNFQNAMVLLFRCATGEDWNLVMYELANTKGYDGVECVPTQTYEEMEENGILGCGNSFAVPFFVSFMIIISMLIMNLSVAAVISGLDEANKENSGFVTGQDIDDFIELWKTYDPTASGYISVKNLIFLCKELPEPLGKKKKIIDDQEMDDEKVNQDSCRYHKKKNMVIKNIDALRLLDGLKIYIKLTKPKSGGTKRMVHFKNVLESLISAAFDRAYAKQGRFDENYWEIPDTLVKKIEKKWFQWNRKELIKEKKENKDFPKFTVSEQQSARLIAKWFKLRVNARNKEAFYTAEKSRGRINTKAGIVTKKKEIKQNRGDQYKDLILQPGQIRINRKDENALNSIEQNLDLDSRNLNANIILFNENKAGSSSMKKQPTFLTDIFKTKPHVENHYAQYVQKMTFEWWKDDMGGKILNEAIQENEQDGGGRLSSDEDNMGISEAGGGAASTSNHKSSNLSNSHSRTSNIKEAVDKLKLKRTSTSKSQLFIEEETNNVQLVMRLDRFKREDIQQSDSQINNSFESEEIGSTTSKEILSNLEQSKKSLDTNLPKIQIDFFATQSAVTNKHHRGAGDIELPGVNLNRNGTEYLVGSEKTDNLDLSASTPAFRKESKGSSGRNKEHTGSASMSKDLSPMHISEGNFMQQSDPDSDKQ